MKTIDQVASEIADFVAKGDVTQGYLLSHDDAETLIDYMDTLRAYYRAVLPGKSYADIAKEARHEVLVSESDA